MDAERAARPVARTETGTSAGDRRASRKRASGAAPEAALRVVIVTLDGHLASAVERAAGPLAREIPGLTLRLHAAADWNARPESLERCREDIARGDIVIASMLFMEEHVQAVLPALQARRPHCDAMIGCMSAGEIIQLTRMRGLSMQGGQKGSLSLLKRLRGRKRSKTSMGAQQLALLKRLPRILRFIPGAAQDLRAYFLVLQYWLAGSDDNVRNMIRFLAERYAAPPRRRWKGSLRAEAPRDYPDVGLYHPALAQRIGDRVTDSAARLPAAPTPCLGTVGLLVMRSYVLPGNTAHYDGVIRALEARGLKVVPAFANGLDARAAVNRYFLEKGRPSVDAVVSLTGFSLVGGPAYNDSAAAEALLAELDVPYISAHATEFQSLEDWRSSSTGLLPVEATMMVAIPELDGATGPMLYGGRGSDEDGFRANDLEADEERSAMLAARVARLVALRRKARAEKKLAVVLFNFPPDAGAIGTAAYLAVFESLHRTLSGLAAAGYEVEVPASVDELRTRLLEGNSARYGTPANVHARIPADDHVRREPWLAEIEREWGPAPGRQQSDGGSVFVLGVELGNVFVGVQPAFGYEGDPMRLLFDRGLAPTHAFSAFYRYLREDFGADAVLHFGTHGALEFMPGKQAGLSGECWPDRLIGDLPNYYLYAANNPSEGTIAKRRSAATLISYLTPPLARAGLYRELADLKASLDRWRALPPGDDAERGRLVELIQTQAAELDLAAADPTWPAGEEARLAALVARIAELESTLIPEGLHVLGKPPDAGERSGLLLEIAEAATGIRPAAEAVAALIEGAKPATVVELERRLASTPAATGPASEVAGESAAQSAESARRGATARVAGGAAGDGEDGAGAREKLWEDLARIDRALREDHEIPALVHALDGGFVRPAPSGDLLRAPEILPTGRNLHGFDPYRIPSRFALEEGAAQAARLVERHVAESGSWPRSIAIVLWGTDNLKSEGGPISQALALIGARPRFDNYGRLCGASLIPLEELGRPRIDVVVTLSGIFRDLLPHQTRLLAEACYLAAAADEPPAANYLRGHALAYQARTGCDLETAALRVFSNAEGAYGSNVNLLVDNGRWQDEDELAETWSRRKCFAYGRDGRAENHAELLGSVLADVDLAYQNLESVELGVTTVDHYFDTLGGISRAVQRAKGESVEVYIGDQTRGEGRIRTLADQVALESRTRVLNPKWYEGMLRHGYEGVRQIEVHVTNTMGWSATTGKVAPWVYKRLTQTFMLDEDMRRRLAELNPTASAKVANRLLEAHERRYWEPDEDMLEALRRAGEELEDRLEGIGEVAA